jgi:hypothetical protein
MAHASVALPYASGTVWFINHEPLETRGQRFTKYGLPRVIPAQQLRRMGEFRGVPLFAEVGMDEPDVYYVPIRPGCEFQPYQNSHTTGAVRG